MASTTQTTNSANNSNTNYNNSSSSTPGWQPQLSALTTAFDQSGGALAHAQSVAAPTGTTENYDTSGLYGNGTTLNSSGTSAASTGLGALSNYNASNTNNTQAITDAANKYVAGQDIPAQVAQATQQANEMARDVTLPQISQNAAINGNTNSSRTGVAEGLVQRGLAENAQNMTGALSSQAYQNGLTLAENQANQNNTANLSAASSAAGQGTTAAATGASNQTSAIGNQTAQNTNNQTNFTNGVNNSYSALQDYMNLIGSQNWGSTTSTNGTSATNGTGTSTATSTPSALSTIGGLLGVAGSLF